MDRRTPHPLSDVTNNRSELRQLTQQGYETELVNLLFSKLRLSHLRADLVRKKRQVHNTPHLTLLDFCTTFSHVPVLIACAIITRLPEDMRFSRLFSRFEETKLFRKRRELMEQRPEDLRARPFALATKWPRLPYGIVLHNYNNLEVSGGAFVLQGVADSLPYRLVLQPVSSFVAALAATDVSE